MSIHSGTAQTEKVYNQLTDISSVLAKIVKEEFLFTWQWWFGIALFVLPWIIWFIFRNKESTGRLLLGGLLTIILSLTIDLAALTTGHWSYPFVIIPLAPFLFLPYHFSLAPVGIMFILQFKPEANPLLKGVLFSAISAFVGMNFFKAIHFYNPKNWSSFNDFFIFLFLYYSAYTIVKMESFKSLKN
ncbi:CBO0543 family protein [Mesobacillus jeotgali]|uniref:CBO0543 family protein n=1 Tax=Mesobacillus jeotgali TaxID=129985 RepID=UPI0009A58C0C|nr:CBO0543 family protein [Mesobacillus jeotgali]